MFPTRDLYVFQLLLPSVFSCRLSYFFLVVAVSTASLSFWSLGGSIWMRGALGFGAIFFVCCLC